MLHNKFISKLVACALVLGTLLAPAVPVLAAGAPDGQMGLPTEFTRAENGDLLFSGAEGGRAGFAQPVEGSTPENPPESSSIPAPSTPSVSSEISATPSESLPTTSGNEAANSNTSETASSSGTSSAAASNSLSDVSSRVEDTNLLDEIDPFDLNANATGVRGFVERLYTLVMGRPAEKGGINHWINEMTSGKSTAANVAHFFFNSPEFENKNTSNEDFLKILYRTMMDREFDEIGFRYWKAFLDDAVSRNYVLRQFVVLPEFTRICERFGVQRGDFSLPENRDQRPELTAFVNRLYRHCMGREGDIGGLNHWTGRLMNRQETGASVVHFFFNSPEFTSKKLNDAEFLKTAYRTLFGREPDQVGFNYWMGVFKTGVSRNYILNSFVVLDEFTRACAAAGIERGSINVVENQDKNPNVTHFVRQIYRAILNREADNAGLNYTCGLILNGQGALMAVSSLLSSAEYTNRHLSPQETIKNIYRALFNREADPAGLAYNIGLLNRGVSPLYVLQQLGNSPEFTQICQAAGMAAGAATITEARDRNIDVTDVAMNAYRALFNRTAGANDLNTLCSKLLTQNKQSVLDALYALTLSSEFTNRNPNRDGYITAIFALLCGRTPTSAEIASWASLLDPDNISNRKTVFFLLANSATCASYLGPKLNIPTFSTQERGIDVSAHQKSINWAQVASQGYSFAMIRVVSSTNAGIYVDPYFYQNVRGARAAGLKVGVYIYSYAKTSDYVVQEVNTALAAIRTMEKEGHRFSYPIAMDIEEFGKAADWTELARLSLVIIDQQGYYPCLYSFANAFKNNSKFNMNVLAGYDLWVAHWVSNPNNTNMAYPGSIWQHSNSGNVAGAQNGPNGRCDLNISYKDFASIIRAAGKNNLR